MKEKKVANKLPKVLVAAPTYSGKHYIFPYWYKNVMELTYPNYGLLIVDNSSNQNYVNRLRREGYKHIMHVDRGENSRIAIARASELIRRQAERNDYDYIMFIETDLLPPKDIIERLMKHEKQVTGAVYEVGIKGSKDAPRRPLLYHKTNESGEWRIDLHSPEDAYAMLNKGLTEVKACGFGCTLIHKSIFNKYTFKYSPKTRLHSDMLFYWELDTDGVPVYADTDLIIPHFNQNWINVKDY